MITYKLAVHCAVIALLLGVSGCSIMDSGLSTEEYRNVSVDDLKNEKECKRAGLAFIELGDLVKARKAFHKALSFDADDAEANNYLGRVYYLATDYPKAIMFLKTAIAIDSQYAEAYYNLGDVYFKNNDRDRAMAYYKKAIDINPGFKNRKRDFYGTQYESLK